MVFIRTTFLFCLYLYCNTHSAVAISKDAVNVVPVKLSSDEIDNIKRQLTVILKDDQETRALIHKEKAIAVTTSIEKQNKQARIDALWEQQNRIDIQNQTLVASILDTYGWPSLSEFGSSAPAQTLFLVVQHAQVNFQEKYFSMMQQATERGDIPAGAFAMLHDRILISKGQKQRYGTQIITNPATEESQFYPIADEQNVNTRRAAVGLSTIEEYASLFKVKYVFNQESADFVTPVDGQNETSSLTTAFDEPW